MDIKDKYAKEQEILQAEINGQQFGPNYVAKFEPVDKSIYVKDIKEKKFLKKYLHSFINQTEELRKQAKLHREYVKNNDRKRKQFNESFWNAA